MKTNLTNLFDDPYYFQNRDDVPDYSHGYGMGSFEDSRRRITDFDETNFCLDCLMVA